ncbi:hypothetical protein [Parasphingorhabdus sp.]
MTGTGLKRSEIVEDLPEDTPYEIYTTKFDVELDAVEYPEFLDSRQKPDAKFVPDAIDPRFGGQGDWQTSVDEYENLFEKLSRDWAVLQADLDELQQLASGQAITLLIDQSGSLRGEKIGHLTASTRWLAQEFERRGLVFEILGFTTSMWKGGQSRVDWLAKGKVKYPGRLNDLLHLVYKRFDSQFSELGIKTMVHPQLLRENVDGEAIQWAVKRLERRDEDKKILVMISDGAPVDDSTLCENGPSFMERHLFHVQDEIADAGQIRLGGVGIGYDVDRYYRVSEGSNDLTKIPEMVLSVCNRMTQNSD